MSSSSKTHEDYDFNDAVLKYINQMLMEEDMEEKDCILMSFIVNSLSCSGRVKMKVLY